MPQSPEMKPTSANSLNQIERLLSICEEENDFWPKNARRFIQRAGGTLTFVGIYLYLLSRDDLWKKHHASIKEIMDGPSKMTDLDEIKLSVIRGGIYNAGIARSEWRCAIFREVSQELYGPPALVELLDWEGGVEKAAAVRTIRGATFLELADAKNVVDDCINGKSHVVRCYSRLGAESLVNELKKMGFVAKQI